MTVHLEARFKIEKFDEKPYREAPDGRKFTRSDVAISVSDADIDVAGTWEALSCYAPDGTATYVGLLQLTGRLGDRTGSVVFQGGGAYDGKQAVIDATVVPASATGELAGIRGTAVSKSTHEDYPFMPLTFDFEVE